MRRFLLGLAVVMAAAAAAIAQTAAPLRALDGRTVAPFAPAAGEVSLMIFVSTDCPISNRYAPEIARIARDYAGRHVRTFLVYVDAAADAARARAHQAEYYPSAAVTPVLDRAFALTDAAGATVTPEAVVVTAAGRAYRGRIDDLYISLGETRRQATSHDLRAALDAVVAGRVPAVAETRAVGCYIDRSR